MVDSGAYGVELVENYKSGTDGDAVVVKIVVTVLPPKKSSNFGPTVNIDKLIAPPPMVASCAFGDVATAMPPAFFFFFIFGASPEGELPCFFLFFFYFFHLTSHLLFFHFT